MTVAVIEIILLFILPVLLLWKKIIDPKYKLLVLTVVSILLAGIVTIQQWPLQKLNIRFDNFSPDVIPYAIFTLIGIFVIVVVAKLLNKKPTKEWRSDSHFLGLFIPISILQEFAFRGFLMPALEDIFTSTLLIIVCNALLFAFLHIIYPNHFSTLLFAFAAGLGFAFMYFYYPNLIFISISHAILNFIAVFYSFFTTQNGIPQN